MSLKKVIFTNPISTDLLSENTSAEWVSNCQNGGEFTGDDQRNRALKGVTTPQGTFREVIVGERKDKWGRIVPQTSWEAKYTDYKTFSLPQKVEELVLQGKEVFWVSRVDGITPSRGRVYSVTFLEKIA